MPTGKKVRMFFEFGTFIGPYPSDTLAITAVTGLIEGLTKLPPQECACMGSFVEHSSYHFMRGKSHHHKVASIVSYGQVMTSASAY